MNDVDGAIRAVIERYSEAANRGDAAAVAALYTDDIVLMAQNAPPQVGNAAVRAAYEGMFGAIRLDIAFTVAEVLLLAPGWALLRSTSAGTIRLLAAGIEIPEANQELFILREVGGAWKIARYAFSTTLPAQA